MAESENEKRQPEMERPAGVLEPESPEKKAQMTSIPVSGTAMICRRAGLTAASSP
jgi:hypothetical protein